MPRKVAEKPRLPTRPLASGCIKWEGYVTTRGYGAVAYNRKRYLAHRYFWEQANGPIPEGTILHHKCGFKLCVNVEHLELLSENDHGKLHSPLKSHCPKGHPYTEAYVYVYGGKRYRFCGICVRERSLEYQRKKRSKSV